MRPDNLSILSVVIIPQNIILKVNLRKHRIKSEQNVWLQNACQLKKMPNLKVENYVFGGFTEDYSWEGSLSDSSEEMAPRGKGGAGIYRSFA